MRLLFDQGVPVPLRSVFAVGAVETAFERDWSTLENGNLLTAAEQAGFDVLMTTDKRMRFQQNMSARRIAIVVLPTTNWPRLRAIAAAIVSAATGALPGAVVEVVE